MEKQEIIKKLNERGIQTENCYPKKSFIDNDLAEPVVGLYKNEFASDFYFYTEFDKTMYVLRKTNYNDFKEDIFLGKTKWLVPLSKCEVVWSDGISLEELELPDEQYSKMTIRDYACIHLKVPKTNYPWLNELIKESQKNVMNVETCNAQ